MAKSASSSTVNRRSSSRPARASSRTAGPSRPAQNTHPDRLGRRIAATSGPWSSQLAANLRRDRVRYLLAFVELRSELRQTTDSDFSGGAVQRSRALDEAEHDYVALVASGA